MFRIWGKNCEHVGAVVPACPPESLPSCKATDSIPCAEFYYGAPNCGIFCRPTDSCEGHYTCSGNGSRVCLPGWTGDNCTVSMATQSAECTCLNGGTWLNGVCVGELNLTISSSTVSLTTTMSTSPTTVPTHPLIIRLINHIKTTYPNMSPDDQLQLLSTLLQQAREFGGAVALIGLP